MNRGLVSYRYAKALLHYTQETGRGEQVCAQAKRILMDPGSLGSFTLEPELQRLVLLLLRNGRMDIVRRVLHNFVSQYYESVGVMVAHLTTAQEVPGLAERLRPILEKQFGSRVFIGSDVDPDLLGGFKIEVGDRMLDASVRSQIEAVRRSLVVNNNRIV